MGWGEVHKVSVLAEKPLATDGSWGRKSQCSSGDVVPDNLSRSSYSHSVHIQVALSGFHGYTEELVG